MILYAILNFGLLNVTPAQAGVQSTKGRPQRLSLWFVLRCLDPGLRRDDEVNGSSCCPFHHLTPRASPRTPPPNPCNPPEMRIRPGFAALPPPPLIIYSIPMTSANAHNFSLLLLSLTA